MSRFINSSFSPFAAWRFTVSLSLFVSVAAMAVPPLTYTLVSGNELWPADKRAAIVAAMDEGVAHYNAYGYFPKALTVNYDTNVPTANGNYNGRINFGGQISPRTAIHEIGHTLGVGTVAAWSTYNGGGTWSGARANARIQLYDGPSATIGCDTQHFWPYGLNFAPEDAYLTRIRHVRMVAALRWDMGIVTDSDADGLPDDWERFYLGTLAYGGTNDFDADGESNLTEYNNDTDPRDGISAFTTTLVVNNAAGAGQSSFNYGPATLSAFFGAAASTPNALINSANLSYLGVNSSAVPTDSNANAINDRNGAAGGTDQERLRITLQNRHGLARLTWQWSRADGPLATDGVSISGFNSNPGAVFSGGISAANPIYSSGKLTFQITAFNGTVNTITFTNPAASSNATLEITVADSTQATPQFAMTSLSFMNLNQSPVAPVIPMSVSLGASATQTVIGGSPAPSDPEGDGLSILGVGTAAHGMASFNSTQVNYTSTNVAAADSFNYIVQDTLGARATNVVNVTLVEPADLNQLSAVAAEPSGFSFRYRGIATQSRVVEATPTLAPPVWVPLATNSVGADGWLHFTNTMPSGQQFFRVRSTP